MNIQDIKTEEIKVPEQQKDIMPQILLAQRDLMVKYQEIEGMPDWPIPFQDKQSQRWIKDFLWRITEEISEAMEALYSMDVFGEEKLIHQHITHFFEEISDAIHFAVELLILIDTSITRAGATADVLVHTSISQDTPADCASLGNAFLCKEDTLFFDVDGEMRSPGRVGRKCLDAEAEKILNMCAWIQYKLGLCGNVLKNKLWKQTAVVSDRSVFDNKLQNVFQLIFQMLFRCKLEPNDIYLLYVSKKLVNQWRQDTKY